MVVKTNDIVKVQVTHTCRIVRGLDDEVLFVDLEEGVVIGCVFSDSDEWDLDELNMEVGDGWNTEIA
jgi:hypothetical protein